MVGNLALGSSSDQALLLDLDHLERVAVPPFTIILTCWSIKISKCVLRAGSYLGIQYVQDATVLRCPRAYHDVIGHRLMLETIVMLEMLETLGRSKMTTTWRMRKTWRMKRSLLMLRLVHYYDRLPLQKAGEEK